MFRSKSGSNQPELISIEFHSPTKEKAESMNKQLSSNLKKNPMLPLDSPAMGTKNKTGELANPTNGTRSKRRLSL
jgi:hypothetical protein